MGGGGAVSWVGDGCGPRSGRYLTRKYGLSNGASLELTSVWASSERCRFFGVEELSTGGRPNWG